MAEQKFIPDGYRIECRGDMVLIGKAIRGNWQMSDSCRASIVSQLTGIIQNDTRDRWRLRATRLIHQMHQQNQSVEI